MEISLREWLVIGGVVVIALIIIDGWRRVRGGRNGLRMDIDRNNRNAPEEEVEDPHNPELPYGGARPVNGEVPKPAPARRPLAGYDALKKAATGAAKPSERIEPTFDVGRQGAPAPTPREAPAAAARVQQAVPSHPVEPLHEPDPLFDEVDVEPIADAPHQPEPRRQEPAATAVEPSAEPERQTVAEDEPDGLSLQFHSTELPLDEPAGPFAPRRDNSVESDTMPELAQEPEEIPSVSLDLEKPVPMLMERARRAEPAAPRQAPPPVAAEPNAPEQEPYALEPEAPEPEPEAAPLQQSEMPLGEVSEAPAPKRPSAFSRLRGMKRERRGTEPAESPAQDSLFAEDQASDNSEAGKPRSGGLPNPDHVLVITVVSKDDAGFAGGVLHRILKACDLHHGEMDIFHRHEDGSDSGPVQFSMANGVNPGTFDPATMDRMQTPGVTFFMSMEEPRDVMNAFECMLATAETVSRHLNGDLLDENRSVLRPQTKEHYRQRIRDYEMHNRSRRGASRI